MKFTLILFHIAIAVSLYANTQKKIEDIQQEIQRTNDTTLLIQLHIKAGRLHYNNSDFVSAQHFFFEALRLAERTNNELWKAECLNTIATAYIETEEFQQAAKFALNAIEIAKKLNNSECLGNAYNSLGNVFYLTAKDSAAIKNYRMSIKFREAAKDSLGLFVTYKNLGAVHEAMKDTIKAIYYIEKSLNYLNEKSDSIRWFSAYMTLGELYVYSGFLEKGKQNLDKAIKYLSSVKGFHKLKDYHYALYQYYYLKKEYEKALAEYAKYESLCDSVTNLEKSELLNELNTKYETEKKEAEIIRQQELLKQAQRTRKLYIAIFVVILLLFLSLFFIYRQWQKRQTEFLLQQQNEKSLQEIFNAEQKERIRIARDLHDSIGQKLAVMRMILPQSESSASLEKVRYYLDETAVEVRNISHNLIPEILNFGLVKAVESLADRINTTENLRVNFIADTQVQQLNISKQTALSLYRVIQEILSNIIRHSKTEVLKIEFRAEENFIQILIEDNGVGFDANTIDESSGLGWKNIFARIKLINGTIKIQSSKNKGSNFLINIPIT